MRVFGLTGGIASGKSAVAERARNAGFPVVDADLLAREVVEPGTRGLEEIVARFGREVLTESGELDRKKLGARVFGDADARRALNSIVHPRISALSAERLQSLAALQHPWACYEAALLVENGLSEAFRPLVVVAVSLPVQLDRLMSRDGFTRVEALARVESQLPLAEKVAMADYVIENDGTLEELAVRADGVLEAIRRIARGPGLERC